MLTEKRFHRFTVEELKTAVAEYRAPLESRRARESALKWKPLYERLLQTVAETMEDGWPFQRFPEGWSARAGAVAAKTREVLSGEVECHFPQRADSNFGVILNAIARAAEDPAGLTGREVGLVRTIVSQSQARYGELSSSARRDALRERMNALTREHRLEETLDRLAQRLEERPRARGLEELQTVLDGLPPLPKRLQRTVELTVERPLCDLLRELRPRKLEAVLALHGVNSNTVGEVLRGWLDWLPWHASNCRERARIASLLGEGEGYFAPDWDPQRYAIEVEPLLRNTLYARYYKLPESALGEFVESYEGVDDGEPLSFGLGRVKRERELRTYLGGDLFALRLAGITPTSYQRSAEGVLRYCRSHLARAKERPYPELLRLREVALAMRQFVGLLSFCSLSERAELGSQVRALAVLAGEPWVSLGAFLDGGSDWRPAAVWQAGFGSSSENQ